MSTYINPNAILDRSIDSIKLSYTCIDDIVEGKANIEDIESGILVAKRAKEIYNGNEIEAPGELIYSRPSGGMKDITTGVASLKTIKGNDIVWNQLVKTPSAADWDFARATISYGNRSVEFTATAQYGSVRTNNIEWVAGHRYIIRLSIISSVSKSAILRIYGGAKINFDTIDTPTTLTSVQLISTADASGVSRLYFQDNSASDFGTITISDIQIIDLTLMGSLFASLTGDTGVATFRSFFPKPYYPYHAGVVIGNKAEALVTDGVNQWDEEWELGRLDLTGQNLADNTKIRSKNYIPVQEGMEYYFLGPNLYVCYYDGDKNFVTRNYAYNSTKTIPSGVSYVRFYVYDDNYGTTYNHDIQIALYHSGGTIPTTYHPYEKHTLPLNIPTITGKKDGTGESVTIFPDGMHGVGDAFDTFLTDAEGVYRRAMKVMKKVDLGTLNWILNGASTEQPYFSADSVIIDVN